MACVEADPAVRSWLDARTDMLASDVDGSATVRELVRDAYLAGCMDALRFLDEETQDVREMNERLCHVLEGGREDSYPFGWRDGAAHMESRLVAWAGQWSVLASDPTLGAMMRHPACRTKGES